MFTLLYYYTAMIIELSDDVPGFFEGKIDGVIVRSFIVVETVYLGLIEIYKIIKSDYKDYLNFYNLQYVVMLILNMSLLYVHSRELDKVGLFTIT